jgi:hypothetical protein
MRGTDLALALSNGTWAPVENAQTVFYSPAENRSKFW